MNSALKSKNLPNGKRGEKINQNHSLNLLSKSVENIYTKYKVFGSIINFRDTSQFIPRHTAASTPPPYASKRARARAVGSLLSLDVDICDVFRIYIL